VKGREGEGEAEKKECASPSGATECVPKTRHRSRKRKKVEVQSYSNINRKSRKLGTGAARWVRNGRGETRTKRGKGFMESSRKGKLQATEE